MLKLGKKISYISIFWFFFYFLIFGLLLNNSFSYLDPDLGWHLKVGEEIVNLKGVPHINNYNYTFAGDWVDHEWLVNLVSYKIFDSFGYISLSIFFALIIVVSLILLNLFIRRYFKKAPEALIAIIQIFGLAASFPHFGVRMQEFSFLFFILELIIIENFLRDRIYKSLFWFLPLFYIWANIHGSFVFGLGILFIFLIVKLLERVVLNTKIKKYFDFNNLISNYNLKIFSLFILGSILVTLITLYGLNLYSFLVSYSNAFYLQVISEWLPQSAFPFNYYQLVYLSFSAAIIVIAYYNLKREELKKINFWHFCLFILLFVAAFKSRRNFPLFFVSSFILLIPLIYSIFEIEKIKTIILRKELKYFLLFAMTITIISNFATLETNNNPFNSYCNDYPCGAVNFLKKESKYNNLNIFNEYNWGGYLIWTHPERKLFIDGRLPQVGYKGHTFIEEYFEFLQKDSGFQNKLDEYDIDLVLLKNNDYQIKARRWEKFLFLLDEQNLNIPHYLRRYLESSPLWEKIYGDEVASVYLRVK